MKKIILLIFLMFFSIEIVFAENDINEFAPVYLDTKTGTVSSENPYEFSPVIKLKIEKNAINTDLKYDYVTEQDRIETLKRMQYRAGEASNVGILYSGTNKDGTKMYVGRNPLIHLNTSNFSFITDYSDDASIGVQLNSSSEKFDYGLAYSTITANQTSGTALSISTKEDAIKTRAGKLILGAGYYNAQSDEGEATFGIFSKYNYKRVSLTTQFASTKYSNANLQRGTVYLSPEVKITDSISLNLSHRQDFDRAKVQDSIGLRYKSKLLKDNNLQFNIDVININEQEQTPRQKLKIYTQFNI